MRWYKHSKTNIKSFYSIVAPEVFYEWEFNNRVPKSSTADYGNMQSITSLDKMVISFDIGRNMVEDGKLICDIPLNKIRFISGNAKSKKEIISQVEKLEDKFKNGLSRFIESMHNRGYFVDSSDKKLYSIQDDDNNKAKLCNYGFWDEIVKKAKTSQDALNSEIKPSHFKAVDLTNLHILTHALIAVDYNIPFDRHKMSTIIKTCNLQPVSDKEMKWKDIYILLDGRAKELNDKINHLNKFEWIKKRHHV